jgi:hypothetical protein
MELLILYLYSRGKDGLKVNSICYINIREYRRGNQKWKIQRNWQQDEEKQSNNTKCIGHHYAHTNIYNVDKTESLLNIALQNIAFRHSYTMLLQIV